jgi:hypothetical protein
LGGNIRLAHVKSFLKEKGYEVMTAQIGNIARPQQQHEAAAVAKPLTRSQIAGLSKREAGMHLKRLTESMGSSIVNGQF